MTTAGITHRNGRLIGAWEHPINIAANRAGSIHDDPRARELGFRGALVSGRVHLNCWVPLLLEAFGAGWFERGSISMDFRAGTLDREPVRAVIAEPPLGATAGVQVEASLEKQDGEVVAIGTVAAGAPVERTWLGRKDFASHDADPYELVKNVNSGDEFGPRDLTASEHGARRMGESAAAIDWYFGESPWGRPIASPALMVNMLGNALGPYLRDHRIAGVPIDGATELRNINGPVFVGQAYRTSGRILARGHSPRTEYFWYQSQLDDLDGRRIAEMWLQWRCVKGSASPPPDSK